jgi:hypothetical protein
VAGRPTALPFFAIARTRASFSPAQLCAGEEDRLVRKVLSATSKRSAAARVLILSDSIAAMAIAIFDSGVAALTASVTTGQATAQWLVMAIKTPPLVEAGP